MISRALLVAFLLTPNIFPGIAYGATLRARAPDPFVMNLAAVDFDQSCSDKNPVNDKETKQDAVVRAWGGALELAADAKKRYGETKTALQAHTPPSGKTKLDIAAKDPAYVQYFKNDWTEALLNNIHALWDRISAVNKKPGAGYRPGKEDGGSMVITCQSVHKPYGEDECKLNNGRTYAITRNLIKDASATEGEDKYSGSSINFCDAFFKLSLFVDRKEIIDKDLQPYDELSSGGDVTFEEYEAVNKMMEGDQGTDATTMLHEWTHLWWVGPTNPVASDGKSLNPVEVYGWFECADITAKGGANDPTWSNNADNYAWYAEYGWKVARLGQDVWPTEGKFQKPVAAE